MQINSSKLKACGNVYYGVLYFLVENVCARRDLTDPPTEPLEAAINTTAAGRRTQDRRAAPSKGTPPSFTVTAGSDRRRVGGNAAFVRGARH